jgi:hypothetical protein
MKGEEERERTRVGRRKGREKEKGWKKEDNLGGMD